MTELARKWRKKNSTHVRVQSQHTDKATIGTHAHLTANRQVPYTLAQIGDTQE